MNTMQVPAKTNCLIKFISSAALLSLLSFGLAAAELEHADPAIEEVIVTSTLHRSRADTALPVNILSGEELREKAAATLGETLQDQVGVTVASFGAGVGAPVIRGQSANRVQVLQGGIGNIDASSISADHANSLEPALAERIEVLRGPATLLYGNGAIGGVVNVIDNRIPTRQPGAITGLIESRNNSASDQQVSVLKLEGGAGQFAWHVDGIYRDSNDVEVSGFAINPAIIDPGDEAQRQALLDSRGKLANSNSQASVKTLGASWILDAGYVGFSFNQLANEYGIPGGIPQSGAEGPAAEGGGTRIVMQQDRVDMELVLPLSGWFKEVHGRASAVDYQHAEVEGSGEIGTLFEQDGVEGRFVFHLDTRGSHDGVLGLHFSHREFSALGEEAFIPATDIDSAALFTVHSIDVANMTYEVGARAERQSLDQLSGHCSDAQTSWSESASAIWHFREDTNLIFALAHSQRSATVEELYSNIDTSCGELPRQRLVSHAATQRLEIGNPNARKEGASNIELGLRKHLGAVTGELNLFYNDIADYIFLFDTGVFEQGVELARYVQEDAAFRGFEAEVNFPLFRSGAHLSELSLFSDYVLAEFDRSGYVPRIPPLRFGGELRHSHLNWQAKLRWTEVQKQSDTGLNESASKGYSLLNFYADYHLPLGDREGMLFFKLNNLLDESIRSHTSLLKGIAPSAGRGVELGLRFEF
jgi:iron complex outermembrane recepter protein